jgi:pyridoxamine 5'-phosphate oxidase
MSLADLSREYSLSGLGEEDLARDPFRQFEQWFQEAEAAKIPEPNAMICSLAKQGGMLSSRTVLLKGLDGRGFVFYSNCESRKGRELAENPRASLLFPWIAQGRQVIVEGGIVKLSSEESVAYFHSRPRASQLSAWASPQSSVIAGQEEPMPPFWGGYRVQPDTVEFWQGRHGRLRYRREQNGAWAIDRLAP